MIDDDDVSGLFIVSMCSNGWFAAFAFCVAIVCCYYCLKNEKECESVKCEQGMSGKLIKHECLCVSKPLIKDE